MSDFAGVGSSESAKVTYTNSLGLDYGEFPLGTNTSRILREDPKLLLFTLARYKFVAKMLSGRENVLEIGCQEGWGLSLVGQVVESVHAIDFFKPYIESCQRRFGVGAIGDEQRIRFEARDILDGPILSQFDGAFALDVLEHIEPSSENEFMMNVVASLSTDGVLILGMPSLESQAYASESSKLGHVNCKSGPNLAAFAKNYFETVYTFCMNDEVLHTGFFPMAHYLFVVCTQPRISQNN